MPACLSVSQCQSAPSDRKHWKETTPSIVTVSHPGLVLVLRHWINWSASNFESILYWTTTRRGNLLPTLRPKIEPERNPRFWARNPRGNRYMAVFHPVAPEMSPSKCNNNPRHFPIFELFGLPSSHIRILVPRKFVEKSVKFEVCPIGERRKLGKVRRSGGCGWSHLSYVFSVFQALFGGL